MNVFKLCAIVSSYFPDLEEMENNIQSYLPWVDRLIIWENTPENESRISELTQRLNNEKVEIRTTGQNEYIAKPFNICIHWAKENGYTHVLTMDQDSRFDTGCFAEYVQKIQYNQVSQVAVFSSNIGIYEQALEMLEVEYAITSGSVYPLSVFNELGMFREEFLIDAVDVEFCVRARKRGFKIICFTKINLVHTLGYSEKTKFGIVLNNYSAQRTYYILRNHIIVRKIYPSMLKGGKSDFYKYKVCYRLAKIIFEKDTLRKTKAIILGVIHGHLGRTGRCDM